MRLRALKVGKICCSCLKRSDTLQYTKPAQRGEADYLSYLAQSRVLFSAPGLMHNRVVFYPVEPFWDYIPRRRIISTPCFELLENSHKGFWWRCWFKEFDVTSCPLPSCATGHHSFLCQHNYVEQHRELLVS